ncbi:MAG: hypothetical protein QGF34_02280 [Candidatus Poseidoniaceae archaeon]|nr:hypothetical protein [Candidatus Poseidoniaceae archaeon]
MAEGKKRRFLPFYIAAIILSSVSSDFDFGIGVGIAWVMLIFTSLTHLVVKIMSVQNQIQGGMHPSGYQPNARPVQRRAYGRTTHYDQMVRKLQSQPLQGLSADQAATQYASFFNGGRKASQPFFSNPQVQAVLGIMPTQATQVTNSQPAKPVTAESAATGAFWSSMPESSEPATEVCGNPTCTTPVNVFDFRCFKCRKRFCAACKGNKITCPSCS